MNKNYISFAAIGLVVIIVVTVFSEPSIKSTDAQDNTIFQETEGNLENEMLIKEMRQENLELRRNVRKLEGELATFLSTVMTEDIQDIKDAIHIIDLFTMSQSFEEAKPYFSKNVMIHVEDDSLLIEFQSHSLLSDSWELFHSSFMNLELRSFEIKEKIIKLNYNVSDSIEYSVVLIDENGWKINDFSYN